MDKKSCEDCVFCLMKDCGYSDWTVEGTSVYCTKNVLPNAGFDRFYGEDDRLAFAEECSFFL